MDVGGGMNLRERRSGFETFELSTPLRGKTKYTPWFSPEGHGKKRPALLTNEMSTGRAYPPLEARVSNRYGHRISGGIPPNQAHPIIGGIPFSSVTVRAFTGQNFTQSLQI
jgi:hypothetical protein